MARMELPLGLSRDPFSIELTFSEDVPGSRTCYTQGNTHTVGNVVDTDSLVLMCDLLIATFQPGCFHCKYFPCAQVLNL